MSDYRRCYVPGGTYFFTCVTHDRAHPGNGIGTGVPAPGN